MVGQRLLFPLKNMNETERKDVENDVFFIQFWYIFKLCFPKMDHLPTLRFTIASGATILTSAYQRYLFWGESPNHRKRGADPQAMAHKRPGNRLFRGLIDLHGDVRDFQSI